MRYMLILAVLLTGAGLQTASANNNFFLPGDAFFPSQLTAEALRTMQAGEAADQVFDYSSFGGYSGAFCGYAGYRRAKITAVDRAFIANLATTYGHLRQNEPKQLMEVIKNGKTQQIETNGMRVLFYPKDFDFARFRLGLQYNEKWVEETIKFGHRREHIRLCELIDDKDAVMESWRDATQVGFFELAQPNVKLDQGPPIEEPVIIKGPVQAIILSHYSLKEYFSRGESTYLSIHVVNSAGIQEYEWTENEWKLIEPKK